MLKVVLFIVSDKRDSVQKLTVNCMELANQVLNYTGDILVDNVSELNIVEDIKMEKNGFELRVEDAKKINRGVLQKVNLDFLQSNGLKGEGCQNALGEIAQRAKISSDLHSEISLNVQVFFFTMLFKVEAILFDAFLNDFCYGLVDS